MLPRVNKYINGNARSVAPEVLARLTAYDWPGNVRELINVLEQAVLNGCTKTEIDIQDLPEFLQGETPCQHGEGQMDALRDTLYDAERKAINEVLRATGGSKRKAAKMLDISRAGFYKKIARLRIG